MNGISILKKQLYNLDKILCKLKKGESVHWENERDALGLSPLISFLLLCDGCQNERVPKQFPRKNTEDVENAEQKTRAAANFIPFPWGKEVPGDGLNEKSERVREMVTRLHL